MASNLEDSHWEPPIPQALNYQSGNSELLTALFREILLYNSGKCQAHYEVLNQGDAGLRVPARIYLLIKWRIQGPSLVVASDNEALVLTGISDSTEPYNWTPSNSG